MAATLEPIVSVCGVAQVWVARSGPEHERYGDPFAVACVVVRLDTTTARLEALAHGMVGSASRALLALRDVLRREGFERVMWQRLRNVHVHLLHVGVGGDVP